MKPLTERQKKALCIVAGFLILLHFAPILLRSVRHTGTGAPARPPAPQVPSVTSYVNVIPPIAAPRGLSPQAQATYLGIWTGEQITADNDECRIRLELRLKPNEPDQVSGYEARSCFNIDKFTLTPTHKGGLAEALKDYTPVATVMTGTYADDEIAFQVDKTVGSSPFVCPLASYTVSQFGQKALVASWRAQGCPAGQMVLTRAGA